MSKSNKKERTDIVLNDVQLWQVLKSINSVLQSCKSEERLFYHAEGLVTLTREKRGEDEYMTIQRLDAMRLSSILSRHADFVRYKGEFPVDVMPPTTNLNQFLSDREYINGRLWPELKGITRVPMVRPDGSLLCKYGYDESTGYFYDPSPEMAKMPWVNKKPEWYHVHHSKELLLYELWADFPFKDNSSVANALATMLTPIVRTLFQGPSPMCVINAPGAGTGKGLLAHTIVKVASGRMPSNMSLPDKEEEIEKRITSMLLNGQSFAVFDNVDGTISSAKLAAALTSTDWQSRVLGSSKIVNLNQKMTWISTGNNIQVEGDIPRRCYFVNLDALTAKPWLRDPKNFRHPELIQHLEEDWDLYLHALLIIVRAWYQAGKPAYNGPVLGSYEGWCNTVGSILQFAGIEGFLGNLASTPALVDTNNEQVEIFIDTIRSLQSEPFTVKDLAELLSRNRDLREAMPDDLLYKFNHIGFTRSLGNWMRRYENYRFGDDGLRIIRIGKMGNAVNWQIVVDITPEKQSSGGGNEEGGNESVN